MRFHLVEIVVNVFYGNVWHILSKDKFSFSSLNWEVVLFTCEWTRYLKLHLKFDCQVLNDNGFTWYEVWDVDPLWMKMWFEVSLQAYCTCQYLKKEQIHMIQWKEVNDMWIYRYHINLYYFLSNVIQILHVISGSMSTSHVSFWIKDWCMCFEWG